MTIWCGAPSSWRLCVKGKSCLSRLDQAWLIDFPRISLPSVEQLREMQGQGLVRQ